MLTGEIRNCLKNGQELNYRGKMQRKLSTQINDMDRENVRIANEYRNDNGKTLNAYAYEYIREMIDMTTKLNDDIRTMLLELLNGRCKDEQIITFINHITAVNSKGNNQQGETPWSWCRWAVSEIRRRKTKIPSLIYPLKRQNNS
jgi:hypothetical protein